MKFEYEDCPHDIVNPIGFDENGVGFIICNQCDTHIICECSQDSEAKK